MTMRDPAWRVVFSPDSLRGAGAGSLPLRIARLVSEDIRRGRLRSGARLPSTRALARMLAVNRNTVVAAYDELASEGWVSARPAGGTFVSEALPGLAPRRFAAAAAPRLGVPAVPGFDFAIPARGLAMREFDPGTLVLSGGIPDVSLVPTAALARAYRRALRFRHGESLSYGDPTGHPRLRAAVAGLLSAGRGLAAGSDDVLVTRGSQMGLYLAARALLEPGDVLAVEELGYQRGWGAFCAAGANLVPVPVDGDGIDVGALAALVSRRKVRAVYVTPHHQYPTTVVLSAARRVALLDLARRARLAIIEDDYDHEFHYSGHPVLPLASADTSGTVVYVGTLSKVLAPGLRLGFVVAPRRLLAAMASRRGFIDHQGDTTVEMAVAELIEDDELGRHARRMRRLYAERRHELGRALERELGAAVTFSLPAGGMSLWARAEAGIDVEAWQDAAAARGVGFLTGRTFILPDDARARRRWSACLRLGFALYPAATLRNAVQRMAAALPAARRRR